MLDDLDILVRHASFAFFCTGVMSSRRLGHSCSGGIRRLRHVASQGARPDNTDQCVQQVPFVLHDLVGLPGTMDEVIPVHKGIAQEDGVVVGDELLRLGDLEQVQEGLGDGRPRRRLMGAVGFVHGPLPRLLRSDQRRQEFLQVMLVDAVLELVVCRRQYLMVFKNQVAKEVVVRLTQVSTAVHAFHHLEECLHEVQVCGRPSAVAHALAAVPQAVVSTVGVVVLLLVVGRVGWAGHASWEPAGAYKFIVGLEGPHARGIPLLLLLLFLLLVFFAIGALEPRRTCSVCSGEHTSTPLLELLNSSIKLCLHLRTAPPALPSANGHPQRRGKLAELLVHGLICIRSFHGEGVLGHTDELVHEGVRILVHRVRLVGLDDVRMLVQHQGEQVLGLGLVNVSVHEGLHHIHELFLGLKLCHSLGSQVLSSNILEEKSQLLVVTLPLGNTVRRHDHGVAALDGRSDGLGLFWIQHISFLEPVYKLQQGLHQLWLDAVPRHGLILEHSHGVFLGHGRDHHRRRTAGKES
mmetsp:Transcript_23413/g.68370  ORF Transcript_23413/g.68370 Transcript_23413/m.68370 type:complete len:522 (-) Transcript_23413:505-2070(-)